MLVKISPVSNSDLAVYVEDAFVRGDKIVHFTPPYAPRFVGSLTVIEMEAQFLKE